jgi:8-oxo-dGTP pyrophosphatase MutT (NUDIX family)
VVEENESPDVAAMRELKEATGFAGTIKKIGPVLAMDPGTSSCSMRLVTVEVSSCIIPVAFNHFYSHTPRCNFPSFLYLQVYNSSNIQSVIYI